MTVPNVLEEDRFRYLNSLFGGRSSFYMVDVWRVLGTEFGIKGAEVYSAAKRWLRQFFEGGLMDGKVILSNKQLHSYLWDEL